MLNCQPSKCRGKRSSSDRSLDFCSTRSSFASCRIFSISFFPKASPPLAPHFTRFQLTGQFWSCSYTNADCVSSRSLWFCFRYNQPHLANLAEGFAWFCSNIRYPSLICAVNILWPYRWHPASLRSNLATFTDCKCLTAYMLILISSTPVLIDPTVQPNTDPILHWLWSADWPLCVSSVLRSAAIRWILYKFLESY